MTDLHVEVVRVFTDPDGRFGNPLGIVDGALVPESDRQAVATALGYSETVYVEDAPTGTLRIYSATAEMPFAGHPTVGAAAWLHATGHPVDTLHVPAGPIAVTRSDDIFSVRADTTWGSTWDWHHLDSPEAVLTADPTTYDAGHTFLWSWQDQSRGIIRARAFAPAMSVPEDEATGSAVTQLTAQLTRNLHVIQGTGSHLHTTHEPPTHATVGGRVRIGSPRTITI
ncbi:PhzF family phenazine biosynthesis protein [Kribbella jiaozuonensis]|uniref:PhzF family phenazine biosynthesis protein n=1 Tax=Kribbella jiaozuonensis TaxID=2575441 RepID=A0A4U3M533_9ACTN|nr:PhzF family phenazine biosynthesis protein [Kribbella jiaozuonensis]TKK82457.1 PhzF family phenazine biosynthesis protein [Kribbella jiaozuonensis]